MEKLHLHTRTLGKSAGFPNPAGYVSAELVHPVFSTNRSNTRDGHTFSHDLDEVNRVFIPQGYWDDLFDNALNALNTVPLDGEQYVRNKLN